MTASSLSCWCGNTSLVPFSTDYYRCSDCETLVSRQTQSPQATQITDESRDFYGRKYYETHLIKKYHYPSLEERARGDLPERCLYWLRALLRYKLPPARVLELGSAHGGFVAILRGAGFEASGLELSPWLVEFARKTFQVPMLQGPLEDQAIAPESLDVIALMDVLEHLPAPVKAMRHCLELLKPDGILLIQTPRYPEGKSYEEIAARKDPFLDQLKTDEHLHLFSQRSITEFFRRLGAGFLAWEPAFFSFYDMFLAVSRSPLRIHSAPEISASLQESPQGRMTQALLDLDLRRQDLAEKFAESEADRAARLEIVNRADQDLKSLIKKQEELKRKLDFSEERFAQLEDRFLFRKLRRLGLLGGEKSPPPGADRVRGALLSPEGEKTADPQTDRG